MKKLGEALVEGEELASGRAHRIFFSRTLSNVPYSTARPFRCNALIFVQCK